MAQKQVTTELEQDRECKSCVLFRSKEKTDEVTTSLYLQNKSYEALGSPDKIILSVKAK